MNASFEALLLAGGAVANLVWLLVNLRIENKIGKKIDELRDWMEERYVGVEVFRACQSNCEQRAKDLGELVHLLAGGGKGN